MHYDLDPKRYLHLANPEAGYARYFAGELESDDVVLLVAEETSAEPEGAPRATPTPTIVGYAYARLEPRSYNELLDACAKLHDVYVEETARGHGVGEMLVREILARMEAKGAPRVLLLTAVQNVAAQRLFARLGFRTTMLEMTRESGA
jgi:ribosomal protein S18 acetylase RimI-like enzyme